MDYLCRTVGVAIEGSGSSDERVNKRTEAGMAEAFRRYVCGEEGDKGNAFFRMGDDALLRVYNGRYFEVIEEEMLRSAIREVMRRCNVGLVYLTGSAKIVADYVCDSLLGDERCRFVADRRYVCFTNGVFDVETGRLLEHSCDLCTDVVMDFAYDGDAVSALWDATLGQTVPDVGMRTAFQQFCGATLMNREKNKFEYVCFCIGEGQNGKSIICKAVVNVFKAMGERQRVVTTYTPEQLFRSQQMDYHMADINGKVLNYCDDVSDKDFSGGDFKSFVSGGEFTGRSPYAHKATRVTKIPLLLCCANRIPPTTDDSDGYFRRFLLISCPNKVSERDKDTQLEAKLREDRVRAAIFNWIYEGYRQLMANRCKIDMSDEVMAMREDMRSDSNSARRWVRESRLVRVEPEGRYDERWKSLREWLKMYRDYCMEYGEKQRTGKSVSALFKELGYAAEKRRDGMWYCIGVEDDAEVVKEEEEEDLPF